MARTQRRVVAVGLTGGIGAGKTTALRQFGEAGAITLSADEIVHGLYTRPDVAAKVAGHFGSRVLDAQGQVDRTALARRVRGRRGELRWAEDLTHPLVAEEIRARIEATPPGSVLVCEIPLLFEAGLEELFDLIVTIEAGSDERRRRSVHSFDLGQFSELESLQASTAQRVAGSDLVFVNDGDLGELQAFVRQAYERALALLPPRPPCSDVDGKP